MECIIVGALILACLMLVPKFVGMARYDAAILRFPFQVDDAEGVVLAEARLIAAGTDPYAFQPSPRRTSMPDLIRPFIHCSIARR